MLIISSLKDINTQFKKERNIIMSNTENTLEELLLMLNSLKAEHDFLYFLIDVIDKKEMEKYRQMYHSSEK